MSRGSRPWRSSWIWACVTSIGAPSPGSTSAARRDEPVRRWHPGAWRAPLRRRPFDRGALPPATGADEAAPSSSHVTMSAVSIRNVWKIYDGQVVLERLNLEVGEHAFISLVGPSGCGKTT